MKYKTIFVFICVPKTHKDTFKNLLNNHHLAPRLICGSNTRAKSVYEAVKQLPDNGFVLIHDGARPFLTYNLLQK